MTTREKINTELNKAKVRLGKAEEDLRRWNEEWRGKLNQLLLEGVAERLELFIFLKEELKSLKAEKKKKEDLVEYFLKKLVEFDEEKENLQAIQYIRRVFNITGAVNENLHYVVPLQELRGASIMERIAYGANLLLHGARQTGKSSHLEYVRSVALRGWLPDINSQVIKRHCSKGLIVIQLNFELVDFSSLDSFWDSIFSMLAKYNPKHFDIDIEALQKLSPAAKKQAFQNLFLLEKFTKLVLLLVDEFDMILEQITIKLEFLSALRGLRNSCSASLVDEQMNSHMLYSFVAAGTYNIVTLLDSVPNQDISFGKNEILPHFMYQSPFNISEIMWVGFFSIEQTQKMFQTAYEESHWHLRMDLDILNSIATDIYERTHGHPGLTSQCGQILKDEVLSRKSNVLLKHWKKYASENLINRLVHTSTFVRMLDKLNHLHKSQSQLVTAARKLLTTYLYHTFLAEPTLNVLPAVDYLIAIGIFIRNEDNDIVFSSPIIRHLCFERFIIIQHKYNTSNILEFFSPDNGSVKILILLQHAVKLLHPQTLIAQEVQNCRKIAEYIVHFELYANIRHIIQALNDEMTHMFGYVWNTFSVLLEAKYSAKMRQQRLDLLIYNSKRFAIELKVDSTSENEVYDAISQLEDYADAMDADESYLIIYTKNLPNIYKQIAMLTQFIIIWLVNKEGQRKLDFVIANQEIIEIDLQKHF
ncbi:14403_t:CDS:2 [Funneliformis mosseae]|uniref:14403_t:CDS:1 n=1 Tax=Funneliformis mosseae TaxID=27381 RepID=A0A9N8YSW9_FUNMO|nr:14403_t:CDS:2 [Funneliformis mosseae]